MLYSSELVLSWMETKFGVQTLHGKCYLHIKLSMFWTSGNFWSSKTNETALVKFIGFFWDVSISLCASQCYRSFSRSTQPKVSRGLRVFLSIIRNLAYTVLRVLSRGQNYRFRTVVTEESWWNGSSDIIRRRSPLEQLVEELYPKTVSAEVV